MLPSLPPQKLPRRRRPPRRPSSVPPNEGGSWGILLLFSGILVLLARRWQLLLQTPRLDDLSWIELMDQWALSQGEGTSPQWIQELPLYNWIETALISWPSAHLGIPVTGLIHGLPLLSYGWVLLWCWGRGNFWSAGLWGLSPWVLIQGLEPGGAVIGGWLLFLGSVTQLPGRFIWLGLACMLSVKTWIAALILAGMWTLQSWPRYGYQGLYVVIGAIVISLIWLGETPTLAGFGMSTHANPIGPDLLALIAPLMLPLTLTLVRLGWPWQQRRQAMIGIASLGHLIGWLVIYWIVSRVQGTEVLIQLGLVIFPLLSYVAGGVLAEIPHLGWRRFLGTIVLISSFLLSLQAIQLLPQRLAS